jgi:hypothetical protein
MTTQLTWEDLFSQGPSIDFGRVFACWPAVGGKVLPIGLSAFGDAFFARPDQTIWKLDTFSGEIEQVARSDAEFKEAMNSQSWQEQHLRSKLVFELKDRGLQRAPHQVFAPVPHPAFTGQPLLEKAQVMDAVVWHSISSQTLGSTQPATKPSTTKPRWRLW